MDYERMQRAVDGGIAALRQDVDMTNETEHLVRVALERAYNRGYMAHMHDASEMDEARDQGAGPLANDVLMWEPTTTAAAETGGCEGFNGDGVEKVAAAYRERGFSVSVTVNSIGRYVAQWSKNIQG